MSLVLEQQGKLQGPKLRPIVRCSWIPIYPPPFNAPGREKSLTLVVWRQYVKNFTGMDLPGFEFGDLIQKLSDERIKQRQRQRQRQLLLRDKRENEHERRLYLEKRIEESEKETALLKEELEELDKRMCGA